MTFWEYFIILFSVLLGGGLAFLVQRDSKSFLQFVLSFGGAYILGITVLHLMPAVFVGGDQKMGLWILAGFIIQLLLEQLSMGVEHGHIHAPNKGRSIFAIQLMLGLCIHAFLEGIPLSHYGAVHEHLPGAGHDHTNHLFFGVLLHKLPAAFALVLLLLLSKFPKPLIILGLVTFACMTPLGAALSEYLGSRGLMDIYWQKASTAVVIGSFLHIATTILFELDTSSHHQIPWKKLIAILLGLGIAVATMH